tara:strand:+ start:260 stop:1291 length:1032 start_codon:yes stop_codon:yes gene_type:complete
MSRIELVNAAKFFKELPHQIAAFNWLQDELDDDQIEEFANIYRSATEVKHSEEPGTTLKTEFSNNWDGVLAAASQAGARYPECVAAQWALESGWGSHVSGTNNFFGLKGKGGTVVNTQEYINEQWLTIRDGFIDFPNLYSSVQYLVDRWYKDYKGYKGVNRASNRNECAKLLVKENYATDPNYAEKLQQIMDRECEKLSGNIDPGLNPNSSFDTKITPHITYGEICLNKPDRRFTAMHQCKTVTEICQFLEKARSHFGNKPVIITSGSRPEPINSEVGGAANSEHTYNVPDKGAVDFFISHVDLQTLENWCDKHWPYSVGLGAKKGFVHIGMRPGRYRVRWDY